MKVGIDSYCYHRFFGDIHPTLEVAPAERWDVSDIVADAVRRGVAGISVEDFMVPADRVSELAALVAEAGLELAWAWGHPVGLASGVRPEVLTELLANIEVAAGLGCRVMRIVCGGLATRPASWPGHKAQLLPLLRTATVAAERAGITLAIENHVDLTSVELVELLDEIDSPHLRVCLDTANTLRTLEDPREAIARLAPYAAIVHLKDIAAHEGNPHHFEFWPSVPLGRGLIDIPHALRQLRLADFDGMLALEIDCIKPGFGSEEDVISESLAYLDTLLSARAS